MCDFIRREDALNCFHCWVDKHGDVYEPDDIPEYRAIEALPSVDAVEVVRCGECKHYRRNIRCVGGFYDGCEELTDEGNEIEMPPDFFCGYGERSRGGETD